MVDILKMNRDKEKILSTIRMRGPSLPVQISKSSDLSPLFASAFLSELKGEEKLKISDMKVGSSPLYYIPGQEAMLENFVQHLNQRERQAFNLLKNSKVLVDSSLEPVVRVAMRYIKDFAVAIKVKYNNEEKLFWKYFIIDDKEFGEIAKDILEGKKRQNDGRKMDLGIIKEEKNEVVNKEKFVENSINIEEKLIEKNEEIIKENKEEGKIKLKKKLQKKDIVKEITKSNEKIIEKDMETEFGKNVKEYLSGKNVEIIEVIYDKKKEFIAKIMTDHIFGKQTHYLIAKDKKIVSDNDLIVALQNAHVEKMPAIVMSKGDINKRGKEYLTLWGNLVKFEKLKF